jgi:hypothetical protein
VLYNWLGVAFLARKEVGKYLAILGAFALIALPWGVMNSVLSFYELFNEVTLHGTGDPKVMAGELSNILVTIILGLSASVPGLILLLIAIAVMNYRPNWVYWLTVFHSTLLLFMIPIGSILGIAGLITIVLKRKSFGSVVDVI